VTRPPSRRSPAPSDFPQSSVGPLSRRQLIAGAGSAVGAGLILAGLGSTGAAALTSANPRRRPLSSGEPVTFGSNYSDPLDSQAIAAAVEATGVPTTINTVDHNTFQENFNTYIQQPDDVMTWFAGYRMRAFASRGVVGDVSDVWESIGGGFSEGFKNASTGLDGKQYFVPFYYYPWAVHYRKSVFTEHGYEVPTTWDEFKALCDQMQTDGLTPLAAANDGNWPQMGMFDMLNLRINGYDFHVSLMGGQESWTDDRVKAIFTAWEEILPYYQPDANGRTWQDAATTIGNSEAGMMLLGTFLVSNFDPEDPEQAEIVDDIDFFAFPALNEEHGQNAVEAPIDGFMMAASPANEEGAKALLTGFGGVDAIDAYISVNPAVVAAHSEADTSGYNALQQRSVELVASATYIAQFLDRDTDPDFAANVVGAALADFIADPSNIDSILGTVEEQKGTYTFE
jgi:multiple sugar transport system substrate-binding protein